MNKWYLTSGKEGDVVISTRIRLARNLEKYPFPAHLSLEQKHTVNETVRNALLQSNSAIANQFNYIDMSKLTHIQAISLAEKHLISPEFAAESAGRALLLIKDESVSIMLNEEDHIRLQSIQTGLALNEAYDIADKIDTLLDQQLFYAFDEKLGYLTQCPTNLGTGMRASVMLHLPALYELRQINKLSNTVSKLGFTIRGTYGEGTDAQSAFYQLSNQVTLGISEKSALENLQSIAMQVIAQERSAREELIKVPQMEDKIFRAYGILLNARLLACNEFMELISLVRLGSVLGLINTDTSSVSSLIADVQPATLTVNSGANPDSHARDKLRAKMVREKLSNNHQTPQP